MSANFVQSTEAPAFLDEGAQWRKSQVENWDNRSIQDRLYAYNVPGIKIAVINNGQIEWTQGYGNLYETETILQAASISKTVAALTTLAFIYKNPHVLNLDTDVSTILDREIWEQIDPDHLAAGNDKVTLRRLLSHTAGINLREGFFGYNRLDKSVYIPKCTREIIAGKGNSGPIKVIETPGTSCHYSGGSVTIARYVVEVAAGKPYEQVVQELIFDPLGMEHSTFIPEVRHTATGYDNNGIPIPGRWNFFPEEAAAGLWSTPFDIAKMVVEIQHALGGKSHKILSQDLAWQMMTPVWGDAGLGVFVLSTPTKYFMHSGWTVGFQCIYIANFSSVGAVIMANSDNAEGLYKEILRHIAQVYEWPDRYNNGLLS